MIYIFLYKGNFSLDALMFAATKKQPGNFTDILKAKAYLRIDLKEGCYPTLRDIFRKIILNSYLVTVKSIIDPENNLWRQSLD